MPVRARLHAAFALALAAGCGGAARPTLAGDLAIRAPDGALREVLPPVDLAVVTSSGGPRRGEVPGTVALGRSSLGEAQILLRFAVTIRDGAEVTGAFLILPQAEGARPPTAPVGVEVARVLEGWSSNDASWGRRPRTSLPELAAVLPPRLDAPYRVDVTSIVRRWAARAGDDHGIALLASGSDPTGVALDMGGASGRGPRLEVYVR